MNLSSVDLNEQREKTTDAVRFLLQFAILELISKSYLLIEVSQLFFGVWTLLECDFSNQTLVAGRVQEKQNQAFSERGA